MKSGNILFLVIIVILLYVMIFLPQRRNQKKKVEMMKQLGPGAKVLTAGGMYAQIVEIHDSVIVATIAEGVEIEMDERAVVRVVQPAGTASTPGLTD